MKRRLLFIAGLVLTIGWTSLTDSAYGKNPGETRKEKREAYRASLMANYQAMDTLVSRRTFVVEADYLENQYGDRVIVPQMLNFIRVDNDNAVLQTGSNFYVGYNGVGGVTAEGKIGKWEVIKDDKSLTYFIRFSVSTTIGQYDVTVDLSAGNNARATITGLWPGKLTYDGHVVATYNSSVFKGQNRY